MVSFNEFIVILVLHGAGIACQQALRDCRQSPKNVIDHWPICIVMLEALNVPYEISSLCTANWRQNYAWGWGPVTKRSMPHSLPQVYVSAIDTKITTNESTLFGPQAFAVDCILVEMALFCPKPPYQHNHRLPGMVSM